MKRINELLVHKEDARLALHSFPTRRSSDLILIAIAIPTFLGARARAQDRAAQSSLRNTVTTAMAIYTDKEDYTTATANVASGECAAGNGNYATRLICGEPSLTFVGAAATNS